MVLRGHMTVPHLDQDRPSEVWGIQTEPCLIILPEAIKAGKSWRQEAWLIFFFFPKELLKRPNTQSQEWGQKWRWRQAQKWIEMGIDREVSESISSPWVLLIPSCWRLYKGWAPKFVWILESWPEIMPR